MIAINEITAKMPISEGMLPPWNSKEVILLSTPVEFFPKMAK
jgi:hypothetical protein